MIKPYVGAKVRVVSVHHPAFSGFVGQEGEITGIMGNQIWVRPLQLVPRKTRQGTVMVRPNHETLFCINQVELCRH